jgi:cytochrome oxidase Cu insertion factor (SCO1/SenC/PrrC family)
MWRKILIAVAVVVIAFGVFAYVKTRLPKPQISFTPGTPAPDFTLQDQGGHPFHLAEQRGHSVVLIFYRGYW